MANSWKAAIAQALASLAAVVFDAAVALGVAAGGREPNPRKPHRNRAVDRVVIDQWLLWRH